MSTETNRTKVSTGGTGDPEEPGDDDGFQDKIYIAIDGVHRDEIDEMDARSLERVVEDILVPTDVDPLNVRVIRGDQGVVEFPVE